MSNFLKANVLVVDDDPRSVLAMRELLESLDQNIVTAGSGEDALRIVLKADFAVILLDVRMPGMDGFTTARFIRQRERSRHTPIIFLTGVHQDVASMFRGYEEGAVDYILKPLVPEVLKSKISVFIDLYNYNTLLTREVGERKLIEENLRKSEENLRALAAHAESVREEERTRIAREIHDELGQALTGLKMDLAWLAERLPAEQRERIQKMHSMSQRIDATIQSVRRISSGLRPQVLDDAGLVVALKWQAKEFQMRTGTRCKINLPPENGALDPEQSTAIFRIFQEVLTNVARHAKATRLNIDLHIGANHLILKIEDNGQGIGETEIHSPKSLGLLGMRERALLFGGEIEIDGAGGRGTRVTLSMPLRQNPKS